ncbi:FUSC family protein [Dyella sp. AtDHG13]|uniref:FUSC family protein n=1 Tax=Dyella sp. AtDHG13 TaxID=1938897 RepID=UPI000942EC9C|nr:FUSC family protein [Dyella sp. AtDHG13]
MITQAETATDQISSFVGRELALTPERRRSIARISLGCAVMVAVTMTFKVPLPAYAAYLVFIASQEDAASTLKTSLGGVVAATIAVAISLLFYIFDAGEPALRIPLLALSTFAGAFFTRTSSLGPIAFLSGYILVLTQTLADEIPFTDPLTHQLLWLWVVVAAPIAVTATMHLLFGESPVALSQQRAANLFERLARHVEDPCSEPANRLRDELIALSQLKNKALQWDKQLKVFAQEDDTLIALLLETLAISSHLSDEDPDTRRNASAAIRAAGRAFVRRRHSHAEPERPSSLDPVKPSTQATGRSLQCAVRELLDCARGVAAVVARVEPASPGTHRFLVPDALLNRGHARFAIKVMLAVLGSYATYTLLDWPGIRTAVTTCFFVSLSTFGESMHKFTLRASGALIGGLMAGLCIVFVMPLLTDIGQLCLLIAAVSAFAAWISTGSQAISYAGMQLAFAFFLGVLQDYGPNTDLTVLRDRIVGILIGNLWVTLVFASLWPVSAAQQARALRAAALKKISAMLRSSHGRSYQDFFLIQQDLSRADTMQARAAFEWRNISKNKQEPSLDAAERIATHALILLRVRDAESHGTAMTEANAQLALQIDALLDAGQAPPRMSDLPETTSSLLHQARAQLEEDLGHVTRFR